MVMNAEDPLFQRERSQAKEDGPSQNGQSSESQDSQKSAIKSRDFNVQSPAPR